MLLLQLPPALRHRPLKAFFFCLCGFNLRQQPPEVLHLLPRHRDQHTSVHGDGGACDAHASLHVALRVGHHDLTKPVPPAANRQVIPPPKRCHPDVFRCLLLQRMASVLNRVDFCGHLARCKCLLCLHVTGGLGSFIHFVLELAGFEEGTHVGTGPLPLHQELLPHQFHLLGERRRVDGLLQVGLGGGLADTWRVSKGRSVLSCLGQAACQSLGGDGGAKPHLAGEGGGKHPGA
mmetsp:Transcript_2924/g.6987  ORF Transcript_2924/g.6987 Transcript_2924/m.6987 type:complete len:234 (-) Transcript_2924:266-967(-)